jgi:acyl dehydratase
MVVRGVYTKAEEAMMAEWAERLDKQVGWLGETPSLQHPYPVFHRVASRDLVRHMACAADCWNPLWSDERYARNTRWGGIIALPMFLNCISHGGTTAYILEVPPEVGVGRTSVCHCYEFFKPIYVGDSFRVFIGRHKLEDITRPEKSANRRFKYNVEVNYINQRDELVGIFRRADITEILPPGTEVEKKDLKFTEEYVYTDEDIAAIDRLYDAEEIRGAEIRYWEDVSIGDALKPVVMGPITSWDSVIGIQSYGIGLFPMIEVRRKTGERVMTDPVTKIPHKSVEFHLSDEGAQMMGASSTTLFPATFEYLMCRLITNWMGDDGFLRGLEWQKLTNVPIGDTIFGSGKVVKKYVNENGDYLVDLNIRVESVRGYTGYVATATVSLLSKEKVLKLPYSNPRP